MEHEDPNLNLIDKAILRTMLRGKRPLSTTQIATKTKINWKTAYTHLTHLKQLGYVTFTLSGKSREYIRKGKQIEAQRTILWKLNV